MTDHALIRRSAAVIQEPIGSQRSVSVGWPRIPEPDGDNGSRPLRILLPYNGTRAARAALDVAVALASGRTVLAWILCVRHWDVARCGSRFCLESQDQARQCAHCAVAELRRRGVAASGVVRDAAREKVAHAIVREAEWLEVGCIVVGTHAHGWLLSAMTGSIPRQIVRTATCPTILVPARHATSRPRQSMRRPADSHERPKSARHSWTPF